MYWEMVKFTKHPIKKTILVSTQNLIANFLAQQFMVNFQALEAQKNGWFKEEIVPVTCQLKGKTITVTEDEGPRKGTTAESLSKMKPVPWLASLFGWLKLEFVWNTKSV